MSLTESLLTPYIHTENDGTKRLMFMVEGVHCAGCMARLEGAIKPVKGVKTARLNLTTKRLVLEWVGPLSVAQAAIDAAAKAGYPLTPYNPEKQEDARTREEKALLRYLAVAGFAGANVMLLSVALWAGAEDSTRQLFQWLSAAIVLPALAYAGQPYFKAAWQALSHRRTSMEVPISIALLLTSSISLYDTLNGGRETYFESAIMLLFFLLIGRYLETRTRGRSHNAAEHLLGLQHTVATVQNEDGTATQLRAEDIPLGATVLCRQGERLAIDGILLSPTAYLDTSVLTGETLPRAVKKGETVQAGTLNTSGTILIKTTAAGKNTTLAEIARLTDTATTVKNKYTRLADRMAQSYAPLVHGLAFLTLSGGLWWGLGGHESITRAAAVLIVTCPCALALAVPTVHVAIMSKLLKNGVILKSGEALEKLADITAVVLDKTGTLTHGTPRLIAHDGTEADRALAARLALHSKHPLATALAHSGPTAMPFKTVDEIPGKGLQTTYKNQTLRLGSLSFVMGKKMSKEATDNPLHLHTFFRVGKNPPVTFTFEDTLRPDAKEAIQALKSQGLSLHLLSGDTPSAVLSIAKTLDIHNITAEATPASKQKLLSGMAERGENVMMVGDGLNDAPSLALAPVGVSFGTSTDLAKLSADVILQQEHLLTLSTLITLAKKARAATFTNIGLSLAYNVVTIPLAMGGYITPMWAALAMSASSLMVTANAARLAR